jgi:hypothetical protein
MKQTRLFGKRQDWRMQIAGKKGAEAHDATRSSQRATMPGSIPIFKFPNS